MRSIRTAHLKRSEQEMQDSGEPPPTAHMPSVPARPPRPPAQLPTLTLSRPRTGACKLVNKLRRKPGASAALKERATELFKRWTSVFEFRVLVPSVRGVWCACAACTLECCVNECVYVRE